MNCIFNIWLKYRITTEEERKDIYESRVQDRKNCILLLPQHHLCKHLHSQQANKISQEPRVMLKLKVCRNQSSSQNWIFKR